MDPRERRLVAAERCGLRPPALRAARYITRLSTREIEAVANRLNHTSRKCLGTKHRTRCSRASCWMKIQPLPQTQICRASVRMHPPALAKPKTGTMPKATGLCSRCSSRWSGGVRPPARLLQRDHHGDRFFASPTIPVAPASILPFPYPLAAAIGILTPHVRNALREV